MKLFILLLLAFTSLQSLAKVNRNKLTIYKNAYAISCHDGDTCRFQHNKFVLKVRFAGIDTPELAQPEGILSKNFTWSLVQNQKIDLHCDGKSFDRLTCTLFLNDTNLNLKIVSEGFAWDSPKFSKGAYHEAMLKAQKIKAGIWKTTTVSPYCFRHKNSNKCRIAQLYME